jgi:hypothetical protein
MDDTIPFASRAYFFMLALLVFSRGMDFLSTWIATPNLALEGNPIAKKLGWKWGVLLNVAICLTLGMWPLSAIVVATASVLVAARNFQSAWLMRSLGETAYREWYVRRIRGTRLRLFLFCLAGNTLLTAGVGAALIWVSNPWMMIPLAIGMGIVAYAVAVLFYSLLAIFRIRGALKREARALADAQVQPVNDGTLLVETCSRPPGQIV